MERYLLRHLHPACPRDPSFRTDLQRRAAARRPLRIHGSSRRHRDDRPGAQPGPRPDGRPHQEQSPAGRINPAGILRRPRCRLRRGSRALQPPVRDLGCGTERCFSGHDALIGAPSPHGGSAPRPGAFPHRGDRGAPRGLPVPASRGRRGAGPPTSSTWAGQAIACRDNDNIHLGKIEGGLLAAADEGRRRLAEGWGATEGATRSTTDPGAARPCLPPGERHDAPERQNAARRRPRPAAPGPAGGAGSRAWAGAGDPRPRRPARNPGRGDSLSATPSTPT